MAILIVVGFKKDLYRASEVLNELVDRGYEWTTDLDDAVAAYRDYTGKLRIDAGYQMAMGEGAALGALFRSLIGLTLGAIDAPIGTGASAATTAGFVAAGTPAGALGAAGGGLDVKNWQDDFGITDRFVQDVGAMVQPGDSAIYALLRTGEPDLVATVFRDYGGVVLSATLNPEEVKKAQDMSNGKNNSSLAGISPQLKKEKEMTTWTELEKQIEPQLRTLAQALDEIDAQEAAAEAELDAKIKAAKADMQADLQTRAAKLQADFEARRTKLQKDMNTLNDQINAAAAGLDAETDKAIGKAKADLEAQRTQMRTDREELSSQFKANYAAVVKHIKNQIEQMRIWAQTTDAKYSAKIDAELDALYKQAVEVDRQVANLHAEYVAAWKEYQPKVERAMADLKEGREKAMADLDAASNKAEAEFKKPA